MASLILGALTAPLWLGLFLLNLNAWRNTLRLYGSAALEATVAHGQVSSGSAQRIWVIATIVGFALLLGFTPTLLRHSFPIPILLVSWLVYLDNISRRLIPPTVLVLTTSTEHGVLLASHIKTRLMRDYFGGVGISFLLRASVRDDLQFQYFYGLGPHNLRQVGNGEGDWKDAVRRLIRLAPCIVLDLRQGTEPMHDELRLVIEDRCLEKTALLTAAGFAPEGAPADQVFRTSEHLADWVTMHLRRRTQKPAAMSRPAQARTAGGRPETRSTVAFERNPYLPLVMDCPNTGRAFRLGVNSATWEDSSGGSTACPICGDFHSYTKANTRTVSREEARQLPP